MVASQRATVASQRATVEARQVPDEAPQVPEEGRLATVQARYGHRLIVADDRGAVFTAVTRSRRNDLAVGDRVTITMLGAEQAVVESVEPRRNLIRRSDAWRMKALAANVDQVAVVIAPSPPYSDELLSRLLIEATVQAVPVIVLANKRDLHDSDPGFARRLALYRSLGHAVIAISALDADITRAELAETLRDRTTLLAGQSGMGKSTLVNALVPDAGLRTQAISTALDAGRHTTTFTRMFALAAPLSGWLVDSPGFQQFGLDHLSASQRLHAMPECRPLIGRCRFHSCTHRDEPGCAIRAAAEGGTIDAARYALLLRLHEESLLSDPASSRR